MRRAIAAAVAVSAIPQVAPASLPASYDPNFEKGSTQARATVANKVRCVM